MSNTPDHKSLVSHHKFPIGSRSLYSFLLVVFFLVPQDALALSVGDRVVVQNVGSLGLNVRTGAGTGYPSIGKVYDEAKGTITSGPRNANGYTWWKVRWNSSHHGWSVDYYDGDRLIFLDEPVKPSISSVGNDSATEGNTLRFTVRLSESTSQSETYYYSTYYGGNATAERGDYDGAAEESIRVSSGRSSFTIRIGTNEDADFDDETFYLYVTGEANHPNSTPGSSKYRGTGTIRDDDEPAVKPSISSVGDASATEGNTLSFTVRLSASTSQTETYYYSTYYGGSATAERGDYDGAVDQSVQVSSGQSSFTIRISTYQDADGDDEIFFVHVAKNSGSGPDANPSNTPGPSQYRGTGTIQDDDRPTTPTTPPTPPTPSGTYTYTFSLNNQTYTVASDNCYSDSDSRNLIERYASSLRIYNKRSELIRPTSDILFQLTAAHASACLIDGIRFSNLDESINLAQERNNKLREEITKGKTTSQITAGIAAIATVIAAATAIAVTGGIAAPVIIGLLGLTGTGIGLFVVAENKEDLAIVRPVSYFRAWT